MRFAGTKGVSAVLVVPVRNSPNKCSYYLYAQATLVNCRHFAGGIVGGIGCSIRLANITAINSAGCNCIMGMVAHDNAAGNTLSGCGFTGIVSIITTLAQSADIGR